MHWLYLSTIVVGSLTAGLVGACRGRDRARASTLAIEARAGERLVARVVPGQPCRAEVDGEELLVGGPPLVAQHGAGRWTAEDAAHGTTFRLDGTAVGRLHARQLFGADGIPLVRVLENGAVTNRASVVVRRASPAPAGLGVRLDPPGLTVTGTTDVVLAAILTAPEAIPALRAVVACHLVMAEAR